MMRILFEVLFVPLFLCTCVFCFCGVLELIVIVEWLCSIIVGVVVLGYFLDDVSFINVSGFVFWVGICW